MDNCKQTNIPVVDNTDSACCFTATDECITTTNALPTVGTAAGDTLESVLSELDTYIADIQAGVVSWGSITGDINNQTDLIALLDSKANDNEAVKSVNSILPDASGNVNVTPSLGFGLSLDSQDNIQLGESLAPGVNGVDIGNNGGFFIGSMGAMDSPRLILDDTQKAALIQAGRVDLKIGTSDPTGKYLKAINPSGTLEYSTLDSTGGTGLEALNEGSGTGWRLIGRDPADYGNIGSNAIDFSARYFSFPTDRGATGQFSFAVGADVAAEDFGAISMGFDNISGAELSITIGAGNRALGYHNRAIGDNNIFGSSAINSTLIGTGNTYTGNISTIIGNNNEVLGNRNYIFGEENTFTTNRHRTYVVGGGNTISQGFSSVLGENNTVATEDSVIVGYGNVSNLNNASIVGFGNIANGWYNTSLGLGLIGQSSKEYNIGSYNTEYTPISRTVWEDGDRFFNIGIGPDAANRHDAFTILKNGQVGIDIDNFEANTTGEKLQVNGLVRSNVTTAEITAASNKTLITKEYADANYTGGGTTPTLQEVLDEGNTFESTGATNGIEGVNSGSASGIYIETNSTGNSITSNATGTATGYHFIGNKEGLATFAVGVDGTVYSTGDIESDANVNIVGEFNGSAVSVSGVVQADSVQTNLVDTGNIIGGTAQFSGIVKGITPLAPEDLATKSYVDANSGGGGAVGTLTQVLNTGNTAIINGSLPEGEEGIYLTNSITSSRAAAIDIAVNGDGHGVNMVMDAFSTGYGITITNNASNENAAVNLSSSGAATLQSTYTGADSGIYSVNSATGNGIVSNSLPSATGFNYVGQNAGVDTFTISKEGFGFFAGRVEGQDPINPQDFATKQYVDDNSGGGGTNPDWSSITNKPTTLSGYGITDSYTKAEADGNFVDFTSTQTISGQKTFTNPFGITLSAASPRLDLNDIDSGVDEKNVRLLNNTGIFDIRLQNDANDAFTNPFRIFRSGTAATEIELNAPTIDVNGNLDVEGTGKFKSGAVGETNLLGKYLRVEVASDFQIDHPIIEVWRSRANGWLQDGDEIGALAFRGKPPYSNGAGAGINTFATENWNSTSEGSELRIFTTLNGTNVKRTHALYAHNGRTLFGGNVGVNSTANASYPLTVTTGETANGIAHVNSSNQLRLYTQISNDNSRFYMNNSAGNNTVVLNTFGASFFNGGNVAIGKTTASERLDVQGNILSSGNVYGDILIGNGGLGNAIRNLGTSTGNANISYASFYENNGSVRQGYVGFPSSEHSNLTLYNDIGTNSLILNASAGENGLQYNGGSGDRTVYHSGNLRSNTENDARYVNVTGDTMTGNITIQGDIDGNNFRSNTIAVKSMNTAPATATSTGTLGEIRVTANYIYVCTATNTWKRTPLTTW